ncbi:AAA family ATPase [Desulfococcaceae bacterium HSG8]|nr:AAA family ATPase [Desulfococcaceae bacterium HSG8]
MQKFLPVGIQDFKTMIEGNFLYIDKTGYIWEMVRPPQGFYFLARPRRFGKSLLVSALGYLFEGRRELFGNLEIDKADREWKAHPVIKTDFSTINMTSPEKLEQSLLSHIHRLAEKHGIKNSIQSLPDCFAAFITRLAEKYNEPVVVLVDEYDKPLIDHLGKGEEHLSIAKENRDILKQFFGVLKGGDVSAALRFVFITGISKFARVSIFSDLNNLNDISMQEKYDSVLGYTDEELLYYFDMNISELSAKLDLSREELVRKIRSRYNGYRFTNRESTVYNPFSVIKLFDSGEFGNYWFETATPSFLINLIREQEYPIADIEHLELSAEDFTVYEVDDLELEPLLFQTGYITIRNYDGILYRLGYPNQEVKTSFLAYLYNHLIRSEDRRLRGIYKRLHTYLKEKKIGDFINAVKSILASIPYTQIANQGEDYYHTVFYLMLSASGVSVHTEVLTSRGRTDIAVEFGDKVYVIELKCNHSSELAIRQILKKKYYEKYLGSGRKIYLMGINFDSHKRTADDWQWGELEEYLEREA